MKRRGATRESRRKLYEIGSRGKIRFILIFTVFVQNE